MTNAADMESARRHGFMQVLILASSNALAFCATPMLMLIGSLLGAKLAPSADWATLPIATMVIGSALGITPVTRLMQRIGRRQSFIWFMALGAMACGSASLAMIQQSFALFCLSTLLIGVSNAAMQQFRFAAMECVEARHAPTAASAVLAGGIFAAIAGPELALAGRDLTSNEYEGAFWLAAACYLLAGALLPLYRPREPVTSTQAPKTSRSIRELARNPDFVLAVTSAAAGFAAMTFIMTGTPISMHHHVGHSLADTKWVIQSHIAAMFLPSLIAPLLFRWFRIKGLMVLGLVCYLTTIVVGLIDNSVMGYWYQLVALGIGWNFLFVAGTALLPQTHRSEERFAAQRFNDTTVFSCQAIASLGAGWAITHTSWQVFLLFGLSSMVLIAFALLRSRQAPAKKLC